MRLFLVLLLTTCSFAQSGVVRASQYAWSLPTYSQTLGVSGSLSFPPSSCVFSANGHSYIPFAIGVPVKITDAAGTSETVNVTSFSYTGQACSVGFANTSSHSNPALSSGTGGLQEAINDLKVNGGTVQVTSDGSTTTANILAATGYTNVAILDLRSGSTQYLWNGTAYISQSTTVTPNAHADGVLLTDAAMTSGSAVLTSASASFTSADIGKRIDVERAGALSCTNISTLVNCNLSTTIASVQSATQVTLAATSSATISGKRALYCSDDHDALQTAFNSAGKDIFIPAGNYCVYSAITDPSISNKTIRGAGMWNSVIYAIGQKESDTTTWFNVINKTNAVSNLDIRDIGFSGTNWGADQNPGATLQDGVYLGVTNPTNIHVINSRFDAFYDIGFHIPGNADTVRIETSRAAYNGADGFNPNGTRVFISNSDGIGNATGFAECACSDSTFVGNYATGNRNVAIAVGGNTNSTNTSDVTIAGNVLKKNYQGIVVASNQQNVTISGNTVSQNDDIGISVNNASGSGATQYIKVVGNIVQSNGCTSAAACARTTGSNKEGILMQSGSPTPQHIEISENTVTDEGITNFQQATGILLNGLTTDVNVTNNHVSGNSSNQYAYLNSTVTQFDPFNTAITNLGGSTVNYTTPKVVTLFFDSTAFASLGTSANGTVKFCSDCTIANPCAGSGTGAIAKRLNGAWVCN